MCRSGKRSVNIVTPENLKNAINALCLDAGKRYLVFLDSSIIDRESIEMLNDADFAIEESVVFIMVKPTDRPISESVAAFKLEPLAPEP